MENITSDIKEVCDYTVSQEVKVYCNPVLDTDIEVSCGEGHRIMAVNGLIKDPLSGFLPERPENPSEISIELFTADGRKWVAEWKDAK